MKRLMSILAMLALMLAGASPAAWATSYVYESCDQIPSQEEAQGTLDDPAYGTGEAPGGPTDPLNLDPDGDGVACNNPGNLVGGGAAPDSPADDDDGGLTPEEAAAGDMEEPPADNLLDPAQYSYTPPEPETAPSQEALPSDEVAPVTPPPGADSPVFQPSEPDLGVPQAPATRPSSALTELPATGGADLLPPVLAGGTLLLLIGAGVPYATRSRQS